jgi:hypothetical protein
MPPFSHINKKNSLLREAVYYNTSSSGFIISNAECYIIDVQKYK